MKDMKKWKDVLKRMPIYLVLVAALGFGLWKFYEENGLPATKDEESVGQATEPSVDPGIPPEELVDNVIQIGDSFSVYPEYSTGHLECKITSARLVTEAADCPREWQYGDGARLDVYAEEEDGGGAYPYDEWFQPGGALDLGAQLVRVEVEITNVDAVAAVQAEPRFDPSNPYAAFREPDLFESLYLFHVTDLGTLDVHGNSDWSHARFFSEMGQYAQEDDPDTIGNECYALQLAPGETKQLSLIFMVSTRLGGAKRDPGYLFGIVTWYLEGKHHTLYIDLNLEETV